MNENKQLKDYILNGNIDLDTIVDDYTPYIRTIINNMVHDNLNEEDKEEIIADTFFILWKKHTENYQIKLLSSYIAGITRNLIKEKLRKIKSTVDITEYENLIENSSFDIYSDEREQISMIKNSLKDLKEIDIMIVNEFYYCSKSIKDIAKELKLSEANVKTRMHRIRKKIRKELERGGF